MAADMKAEERGLTRTLKDLFAGAAGGIAQVLIGQYLPIFAEDPFVHLYCYFVRSWICMSVIAPPHSRLVRCLLGLS